MWLSLLVAALTLAVDRITKLWAYYVLQPIQDIPLWEGVFHLTYARNTGAAFSFLAGKQWILIVFTLIAVGIMGYFLVRYRSGMGRFLRTILGLLLGGAIGNLIDRIVYGYVIDFLYFKLINFAIFNVADSCLVIGAILLGIYILFFHDRGAAQREKANGNEDLPSQKG